MKKVSLSLLIFLLFPSFSKATSCIEVSKVCVDNEDREINGEIVHADCWKYERTFECRRPNPEKDRCSKEKLPETCSVINLKCSDGVSSLENCSEITSEITCEKRPSGPGISEVKEEITKTRTEILTPNPTVLPGCKITAQTCLESGEKLIPVANASGVMIPHLEACWKVAYSISCPTQAEALSCKKLEQAGCREVEAKHCELYEAGSCVRFSATYVCSSGPITGDDIEVGEGTEIPDGSVTVDKSECETKLKEENKLGASCHKESEVCTKENDVGKCLNFTLTYSCTKNAQSTCSELEALAKENTCKLEKKESTSEGVKYTYSCGTKVSVSNPPGEAQLVDKTEIVEAKPINTCKNFEENNTCVASEKNCIEGPGIRYVDGRPVYQDCWKFSVKYQCKSSAINDCEKLEADKNCKFIRSECPNDEQQCERPTKIYECTRSASSTTVGRFCDDEACIEGICTPVNGEPNKSFVDAVVGLEIGRELGMYGDISSNNYFAGEHLYCKDRLGAPSCCRKEAKAALSNEDALGLLIGFGFQAGGEYIKWLGSPYVYDILSYSPKTKWLLNSIYGTAGNGVYEPSLSYWGITASYTEAGNLTFDFSPQGFLLAAATHLYMQYRSCSELDQKLALAKAAGLCVFVGTTCGKVGPTGCIENRQHYVCFNSKLARILHEQGRAQLGRSFGFPEKPDARGFTEEELQELDFSKIDFSEFIDDVLAQSKKSKATYKTASPFRATSRVNAMVKGEIGVWAKVPGATSKKFIGKNEEDSTKSFYLNSNPPYLE